MKINELLNEVSVLNCDTETGKFYGRIKKELQTSNWKNGNNLWVRF